MGKLCFVELATVMARRRMGAGGPSLDVNPNPSLAALQNVLHKVLSQTYVPWRESKLAMIARDCLQAPAKAV